MSADDCPSIEPSQVSRWRMARRIAGVIIAAGMLALCGRVLWHELRATSWDDFWRGLTEVGVARVLMAAALIGLNYGLLISYDVLALNHLRHPLSLRRTAMASFICYSLGNNLGTLLVATPLRFRFYTRWGLRPTEVTLLVSFTAITYYCGATMLLGLLLTLAPPPLPETARLPISLRWLGPLLLALWLGYLSLCSFVRRPFRLGKTRTTLPTPQTTCLQTGIAMLDLLVSATALYLILPTGTTVPFLHVAGAYLLAMGLGLLAQVPGQLGVLDATLLTLLKGQSQSSLLGTLVLFRALYYLVPLILGTILLCVAETGRVKQARADG